MNDNTNQPDPTGPNRDSTDKGPAGDRSGRFPRRTAVAATTVVAAIGLAVPAVAAAGGDDDDANEQPITGEALEKASAAALEHLGEGRVTETEVEDEESYYEVEVTLDDGRQVDVQLDESFNVVDSSTDTEDDS